MKFLAVQRPELTTVTAGWVAHVGSANERPGITGISHLFEHMMFKGTQTIGTTDSGRDLEIIEEQEKMQTQIREVYEQQRERYRRGEIDDPYAPDARPPELVELQKRFDELVDRAARPHGQERVRPDLHDRGRLRHERLHERTTSPSTSSPCPPTSSSSGSGWSRTGCSIPCSASSTPSATSSTRSGGCAPSRRRRASSTSSSTRCSGSRTPTPGPSSAGRRTSGC